MLDLMTRLLDRIVTIYENKILIRLHDVNKINSELLHFRMRSNKLLQFFFFTKLSQFKISIIFHLC